MDMTNIEKLKKARLDIEEIEEHLKERKKRYTELMEDVFSEMVSEQIDSIKHDGTLFILQVLERPSLRKEQEKQFFRYLQRNGFGDLIVTRRAVSPQTLGKWFRWYIEDTPRKRRVLDRYLKVYPEHKVLMRGLRNGTSGQRP